MKNKMCSVGKIVNIIIITVCCHIILLTISVSAVYSDCIKSNFIVAIDIGHSAIRSGATSSRGVPEYLFNKRMASELYAKLMEKDFSKSFIINTNDDIGLKGRTEIANNEGANLLISIHHDSVQPFYLQPWLYKNKPNLYCDKYRGYSIFYSSKNKKPQESLFIAKSIGQYLVKEKLSPSLHHAEKIQGENRELIDSEHGVYRFDNLGVLKASMAAVLLECGIIVNRNEEETLDDFHYREKIVNALVAAIANYCSYQ